MKYKNKVKKLPLQVRELRWCLQRSSFVWSTVSNSEIFTSRCYKTEKSSKSSHNQLERMSPINFFFFNYQPMKGFLKNSFASCFGTLVPCAAHKMEERGATKCIPSRWGISGPGVGVLVKIGSLKLCVWGRGPLGSEVCCTLPNPFSV